MTEPRTSVDDPILALLPAERPWAFDGLPFEEQQWRARIFLAVWIQSGGAQHEAARSAFAWQNALMDYSHDDIPLSDYRSWVERNLTLEVIQDGLASLNQPGETVP